MDLSGGGIELCGCSSFVSGLRSLLNTEGILTLPMFLLSDGSLIQMWSASLFDHIGCCCLCLLLWNFKFCFWENNTQHSQAKETFHICIKDPSLNRNIGKVKIPSVFNKLPKPYKQLEQPHSFILPPKGAPSLLGLSTQKAINTSHLLDLHLQ